MRAASTAWMLAGSSPRRLPGADRDELLDEQRVALGALRRSGRRAPAPRRSASSRACVVAERVEHEHARGWAAARPTPGARSSSSGRVRQTSRIGDAARERDDVVEQVQQRRLAPSGCPRPRRRAGARGPGARAGAAAPRRSPRPARARRRARSRRGCRAPPARRRPAAPRRARAGRRRRARGRCRRARGTSCPRRRPGSGRRGRWPRSPSAARNSAGEPRLADPGAPGDRDEPAGALRRAPARTRRAARRARARGRRTASSGVRSSAGCSAASASRPPGRRRSLASGATTRRIALAEQDLALASRARRAGRRR